MIIRIVLSMIFFFSICGKIFCFPIEVKDDLGKTIEIPEPPQRIVSLGPVLTEELYLLGVENMLVANTIYCTRPPEAEEKEKIGTVMKVDIEKIVSLEPDLVLTTSLSNPEQVEKLRNLGIKVFSFTYAESFLQICDKFLRLGRIVGEEEEAEKIVCRAKEKVDSIRAKVEGLPKPGVFVQIGAKPLFTIIEDSFVNDFIDFAGGINIVAGIKTGLYSREKVLQQNPDVIIIATMGIVGEQERQTWQKYRTLNAVKNNRIYIVDSYGVCSPTPVSFVDALEEIVDILHPEINEEE